MKKKLGLPLIAVGILLAAAWLWYTRPLTLEELCPDFDISTCAKISITYQTAGGPFVEDKLVELLPGNPQFEDLLTSLEGHSFSRSLLRQLLPVEKAHTWREGDFWWKLSLSSPHGTVEGGWKTVMFDNFFGSLTLYGDDVLPVRTAQQKGWLNKVLFLAQAAEG